MIARKCMEYPHLLIYSLWWPTSGAKKIELYRKLMSTSLDRKQQKHKVVRRAESMGLTALSLGTGRGSLEPMPVDNRGPAESRERASSMLKTKASVSPHPTPWMEAKKNKTLPREPFRSWEADVALKYCESICDIARIHAEWKLDKCYWYKPFFVLAASGYQMGVTQNPLDKNGKGWEELKKNLLNMSQQTKITI